MVWFQPLSLLTVNPPHEALVLFWVFIGILKLVKLIFLDTALFLDTAPMCGLAADCYI